MDGEELRTEVERDVVRDGDVRTEDRDDDERFVYEELRDDDDERCVYVELRCVDDAELRVEDGRYGMTERLLRCVVTFVLPDVVPRVAEPLERTVPLVVAVLRVELLLEGRAGSVVTRLPRVVVLTLRFPVELFRVPLPAAVTAVCRFIVVVVVAAPFVVVTPFVETVAVRRVPVWGVVPPLVVVVVVRRPDDTAAADVEPF